jgi:hypothetical protein
MLQLAARWPRPQFRVRTLMIVTTLVAIYFGAGRAFLHLLDTDPIPILWVAALIVATPMCLALHLGVFRLLTSKGRGQGKAFWAGFLICGSIAMASCAWAVLTPSIPPTAIHGGLVQPREQSSMNALWNHYYDFATRCLTYLHCDVRALDPRQRPFSFAATVGLVPLPPQLFLALAGGLITRSIARLLRSHSRKNLQEAKSREPGLASATGVPATRG